MFSLSFGGPEQASSESFPKRQLGVAPVGGHLFAQVLTHNGIARIQLNGTDPDGDGETLQYFITQVPQRGRLYYTNTDSDPVTGPRITITKPIALPLGVRSVIFEPIKSGGGYPYATFQYVLFDGQLESGNVATVQIFVACPAGSTIDQPAYNERQVALTGNVSIYATNPNLVCQKCQRKANKTKRSTMND